MSWIPGVPFITEFITQNATGAATNADLLPVATMSHNGSDDLTVALTVTNIDTGRYRITGAIPSSYGASDAISILVVAQIGGVAGVKQIVYTGPLEPGWTPGQTLITEFITSAASGAAVNADTLPMASLGHNGIDDGTVAVAVTPIDAGRYAVSAMIPITYAAGDAVSVLISAAVAGIAMKEVIYAGPLAVPTLAPINPVYAPNTGQPTLLDLRTQISDLPRPFPANSDAADTIGLGDGVRTVFFTRFPNFVLSSLVVFFATPPAAGTAGAPAYVAQSYATFSVSGNQITFVNPPPAGVTIATQYNATYFSDAALTNYLAAAAMLQTTWQGILNQAQFALINVIIGDMDKWIALTEGDYKRDPAAILTAMMKLADKLRKDLTGDPRAGRDIPAFGVGVNSFHRYDVRR